MKTNFRPFFTSCFISSVLWLTSPTTAFGQNSNPPLLAITPQREPQISVYGLPGARYELQYTPTLSTSNWQVLTNFILGASPFSVVDSNAPLAGIRMYRALLLETNASVSYAPASLSPAEIFRFNSQSGPAAFNNDLVLNSATTGMLVRQDNSPNNGISPVTVSYNRVGPFLAELSVIRPAADALPAQTNFYTLVFTGPGAGFFQFTDGPTTVVGEFSRDQSFIGQQLAPVQLTAGESYSLLSTNFGITNLNTLVINSTTSGILIDTGMAGYGITPVTITYQKLGPLSSELQVVIPLSPPMSPITNVYYLVYGAANSGAYQSKFGPGMITLGVFTRDQSLVGQQIAPAQLTAGESYGLLSTNNPPGITNLTTLVINSATSGVLISPGYSTPGSITPVSIEYQLLGPLSSQMQVIIPPGSGFITPQTNFYYFVYTTTNSGAYQSISGPPMVNIGPFTRDPSLVGQQLAPLQLTAGESYSLLSTNAGITNLTTLVINSTTSGMWISPGNPPPAFIAPVSITYQRLGPLSSQLQVIIPATSGFSTPQTNWYYLVYSSPNSGAFQDSSGPAMNGFGPFTRDQSLVGQPIAPLQLTAGESYSLLNTNFSTTNLTTLVINSATSGFLVTAGNLPGSGITAVSLEYQRLGPLSSQLQVVIPATGGFPTPQTNWYYLVFSSPNSGTYQSIAGAAIITLGPFTRDQSLVGQQIAPAQLTSGESYQLTASNGPSVLMEALVVNSATNGILVVEGSNPEAGIYPNVALQYLALGNLAAQCQVVIPATPPMILTPRTNTYLFVYTSHNAGQFQRSSDSGMVSIGEFLRNPAQ